MRSPAALYLLAMLVVMLALLGMLIARPVIDEWQFGKCLRYADVVVDVPYYVPDGIYGKMKMNGTRCVERDLERH